jgi:hypothetical protein
VLPYNLYLGTVPGILNTSVWGDGSGGTVVANGSMKLQQIIAPVVTVTFPLLSAEKLASTLRQLSRFGISDAFPSEADLTTDTARHALLSRARRVARRLRSAEAKDGVLDHAAAHLAAATPDKAIADQVSSLVQAGQALFSDTLKFLPAFTCHNEVDLAVADGARAQLLAHAVAAVPGHTAQDVVDEWLQGLRARHPGLIVRRHS